VDRLQKHSFALQLLNASTQTYAQQYDSIPGVTPVKFPVLLVGNWRGSFLDGKFTTFWSYSVIQQVRSHSNYYTALGNQVHLKKWLLQYDLKYNPEDVDHLSIITGIVPKTYSPFTALNTLYLEHWLHVEYNFLPSWKATVTGMSSATSGTTIRIRIGTAICGRIMGSFRPWSSIR
jgi:hypothetical protein